MIHSLQFFETNPTWLFSFRPKLFSPVANFLAAKPASAQVYSFQLSPIGCLKKGSFFSLDSHS